MPFLYNFGALIPKTITIMKKFIIALVAVVLGLSSCSKEASSGSKEAQLLGSWKFESLKSGSETLSAADLNAEGMVFTFKEGNTLEISVGNETISNPYSTSGNQLILGDSTMTFEVSSKKLVLTFTVPAELEDEEIGLTGTVKFNFKKL